MENRSSLPFASGPPTRLVRVVLAFALASLLLASPDEASAQERGDDARIPAGGELWIEIFPTFEDWHEQFARSSPLPGLSDGDSEPLTADFDGPVVDRLFPGVAPLLADLNADAVALGFDSLTAADVSLGVLDFRNIDVDVRRVPFALRYGVHDRVSVEVVAPLVLTEVEPFFSFDSTLATLIDSRSAVTDAGLFFPALQAAIDQLQLLRDSGTLSPEGEATADALLESSAAFETALSRRVGMGALLPHAGTRAGLQIATRFASLEGGFAGFGIGFPSLAIPAFATSADLDGYLTGSPVGGEVLAVTERGWDIGELQIGIRLGLLDTFGRPRTRPGGPAEEEAPADTLPTPADTLPAPADTLPAEPEATHREAGGEAVPTAREASAPERSGLRVRTTIGAKLLLPLRDADRVPFLAPENFLGVPIGDGQRDVELALYQDIQLGSKLLFVGVVRYGIQLADELTRRVAPPDRPFAFASTQVVVERDLGDYLALRLSPRLTLNDVVSFGVEYSLWDKGRDSYRLLSGGDGVASAAPLELETAETRHRLGIGVFYRTTGLVEEGRARLPIELHFIFQTAIAGSGGQTPVSSLISTGLRVPISLF